MLGSAEAPSCREISQCVGISCIRLRLYKIYWNEVSSYQRKAAFLEFDAMSTEEEHTEGESGYCFFNPSFALYDFVSTCT